MRWFGVLWAVLRCFRLIFYFSDILFSKVEYLRFSKWVRFWKSDKNCTFDSIKGIIIHKNELTFSNAIISNLWFSTYFRHANRYSSYSFQATALKFLHSPHEPIGQSAKVLDFWIFAWGIFKRFFCVKKRVFLGLGRATIFENQLKITKSKNSKM